MEKRRGFSRNMVAEHLVARCFTLVDDAGMARAQLAVVDGAAQIWIGDGGGNIRIFIGMAAGDDTEATLSLCDRSGGERFELVVGDSGEPRLAAYDESHDEVWSMASSACDTF